MMTGKIVFAGAVLCLLAGTAGAQMGGMMRPPQYRGVWNPVVGGGAVYSLEHSGGEKTSMEMTVVGKETVEGKEGYWFELVMDSPRGEGQVVMKMLFVLDGDNTVTRRMIMQMPGRDPMEMPMQMMQARGRGSQPADVRGLSDDAGSETVTTPAGTFACEHYRMKDGSGDAWVAKNISPYGLVKYTGKDTTMVLTKVITDAKDKITGTPKAFNPMEMGRPPN